MSIRSKQDLAVYLSKLKSFENPSMELEQYATPSQIAATWVWDMAMRSEIAGKRILDAACGPGILGMGLLLLGARHIYFLDKDPKILAICKQNYDTISQEYDIGTADFLPVDIRLFDGEVDLVVQNPPFGTKNEHIDKVFLEKAFSVAPLVYSMHKTSTKSFVEAIARDHAFSITQTTRYDFPIKAAFEFHTKPVMDVDVTLWRLEKKK
ncbi:methyltransferase [Candidatus Woesearchaeota archaeon]|nr:methyltransferase [Candidatus Woesearchaeota archaeon]